MSAWEYFFVLALCAVGLLAAFKAPRIRSKERAPAEPNCDPLANQLWLNDASPDHHAPAPHHGPHEPSSGYEHDAGWSDSGGSHHSSHDATGFDSDGGGFDSGSGGSGD